MRLTISHSLNPGGRVLLASQPVPDVLLPVWQVSGLLPNLRAGQFLYAAQVPEAALLQVEGLLRWPATGIICCTALMLGNAPAQGQVDVVARRNGYSVAWVTLSDKGSKGLREDTSGPRIEALAREAMPLSLCRGYLLPDDGPALKALLTDLALTQGFDFILTTGGTGVGPRDVTPEATLAVIDKRLPGFEQVMTLTSLKKTPHGAISRAVAGTLGQSIIVNLPGSPKAVAENLAAVLPALAHASDKLRGDEADCAQPAGTSAGIGVS